MYLSKKNVFLIEEKRVVLSDNIFLKWDAKLIAH
jgi:hypothetical protein